jgi:lysine 2,3-aminomutase
MSNKLLTKSDFDPADWVNPKWQLKNSIRTLDVASQWLNVTAEEAGAIDNCSSNFKWSVTPYYMSLMDKDDPNCPVRLQAMPNNQEMIAFKGAEPDPVGDTIYMKTNRVVHKYPNRVIFLATDTCPVYCRHCTRKEHTMAMREGATYFGEGEQGRIRDYDNDFSYIAAHPEIEDVLITGGDPLSLVDKKLEQILTGLRGIPHIKIIRIGSRFPVLMPQRITDEFCDLLERHKPMWFSTHFNHPKEITPEAIAAVDKIQRRGITVQNQTVLLKNINNDVATMRALNMGLVMAGIRPYYLYHCDNVSGVSHFMTTVNEGLEIMRGLKGHITGFASPEYIVTTRIGKIALTEQFTAMTEDGKLQVTNYKGETYVLPYGMDDTLSPK